MANWRYVALDATGRQIRGTMEAPDEATVARRLQAEGKLPMRADPATGGGAAGLLHLEFSRAGLRRVRRRRR